MNTAHPKYLTISGGREDLHSCQNKMRDCYFFIATQWVPRPKLLSKFIIGSFMQVQKTVTIGYEHAHLDFVRSSRAGDRNVRSLHEFKHAL